MVISIFFPLTFVYSGSQLKLCFFSDLQGFFFLSFKQLLKKENIVMVHFNWSPGNMLVMPAHPEVKRLFHCSNIVFFMEQL